jgi:hypothetical protein
MKRLILPFFVLIASASTAQLSIIPQAGLETFRTTIKSGDLPSFSPMGQQFAPSIGVRMAYTLKSGQGAFVGVATNSPAVKLQFTDPKNAQTNYQAAAENVNLRLEAGYQYTSKPIALRKAVYKTSYRNRYGGGSIGVRKSGCTRGMCSRTQNPSANGNKIASGIFKDKGLYMRIKPSLGLAMAPIGNTMETETKAGQTMYSYKAGLSTALIAGTSFEFGTVNQPKFIISINYFKGLGDNMQTLIANEGIKATATTFSSTTSGFNINLGIPFNLKKKPVVQSIPPSRRGHYGYCNRNRMYVL